MIDPAQLPDAKNPDTAMLKFHISCLENEMLAYRIFDVNSVISQMLLCSNKDKDEQEKNRKNQQLIEEWLKTAKAELEARADKGTACIEVELKD
jgi:hypothetical protein